MFWRVVNILDFRMQKKRNWVYPVAAHDIVNVVAKLGGTSTNTGTVMTLAAGTKGGLFPPSGVETDANERRGRGFPPPGAKMGVNEGQKGFPTLLVSKRGRT